jgi:hypothetical protein
MKLTAIRPGAFSHWYQHFHFLLVPVFFIIHNYVDFYGLVLLRELLPSFIFWILLPVITAFLCYIWLRPLEKALLYTAVLMLCGFFSIPLKQWLQTFPLLSFAGRYSVFIPLLAAFLLIFFLKLKKSAAGFPQLSRFLTFCLLALSIYEVGFAIVMGKDYLVDRNRLRQVKAPVFNASAKAGNNPPDIYYLVYDALPGSQETKEILGLNDTAVRNRLMKMGFKVQDQAQAAAASTHISLFSTLNMCYPPFENQNTIGFRELHGAVASLEQNNVVRFLQDENYQIVNAGIFPLTDQPGLYKRKEWAIRSPEYMIYNQTFWSAVYSDFAWLHDAINQTTLAERLNDKIKKEVSFFKQTEQVVLYARHVGSRTKFVYAHFNLPHGPYKFRADGSVIQWVSDSAYHAANRQQLMQQQVLFTHKVLPDLCASIQQATNGQAVIIVQGDHGLRGDDLKGFPASYAFNTFSAVYFPGCSPGELPDSLYLPNTFRLVFNRYFGQSFPLLKPRSFDLTYFRSEQIFRDDL